MGDSVPSLAPGRSAQLVEDRRNTLPGLYPGSHLGPHDADPSSDPGWQARSPDPLVLEGLAISARLEKRLVAEHSRKLAPDGDVHNWSAGETPL